MFAHKILLKRLISFCCHLHGLIDQCHLVDEQIAEDSRAVHHHINTGASQLLKRNELKFVDSTNGVRHGFYTHKPEDLGQRFSVGLDVVRAPEDAGNGFGPSSLLLALALDQLVHHPFGRGNSSPGWDRLRVKSVDVFATGENSGIANRITTRSGEDVFAIECFQKTLHLHIGADLLKAETQIAEQPVELRWIDLTEPVGFAGLEPW